MSAIDQLYHDGGGSKLSDFIPGNPRQDAGDRVIKNAAHEIKRAQRIGRRAYRSAMKTGNYGAAMDAYDWATKTTGSTGAGIGQAGTLEPAVGRHIGRVQDEVAGYGGSQQGRIAGAGGEPRVGQPAGTGDGSTPENAAASSSGGQWVSISPSTPRLNPNGNAARPTLAEQDAAAKERAFGGMSKLNPVLDARQSLFSRMKAAAQNGQNPWEMKGEAASLGISDSGFASAMDRLEEPSTPLDPNAQPSASSFSPVPSAVPQKPDRLSEMLGLAEKVKPLQALLDFKMPESSAAAQPAQTPVAQQPVPLNVNVPPMDTLASTAPRIPVGQNPAPAAPTPIPSAGSAGMNVRFGRLQPTGSPLIGTNGSVVSYAPSDDAAIKAKNAQSRLNVKAGKAEQKRLNDKAIDDDPALYNTLYGKFLKLIQTPTI